MNVETSAPGRTCPLHYHYGPAVFNTSAQVDLSNLDVLYAVGGLYGNELALSEVLRLFERERGRKRLVFNGDFHWFDINPPVFERVQREVLAHTALRGNVETELADASAANEVGCGCAYPEWVNSGVVERSNQIMERLRTVTTASQRVQLAALPMHLRASVGGLQIGIVHGDAQSLAGWGFAQESLRDPQKRTLARRWFLRAQVDAFACTHTCLPVFQRLAGVSPDRPHWILNNGAAGMPNFSADFSGLLTRIALAPFTGKERRLGIAIGNVLVDALAIEVDAHENQRRFLAQWPPGSQAYASYYQRIAHGPLYTPEQVIRLED